MVLGRQTARRALRWGRLETVPRWIGGLTLLVALGVAMPARAENEDEVAARRQAAQDLADSAFDLLQKQRYAAAAELFQKADATFHSPVFGVFRAEALEKQGKLLEARALLQQVIEEELAEYAPDAFREAQDKARERVVALDEKIPTVTIVVVGRSAGDRVTLNGQPVSMAEVGTPMQVAPGSYRVSVESTSGRSDEASLELAEGDRAVADLDVSPTTAPQPITTGADPVVGESTDGDVPSWVWPTVAYGVGGVGLIMGVAAGGVFLSKQSALKEACEGDGDGDPNTCPSEQQSEGDSVKTVGNVSTAGWVIAGIGAVAGTVLLLVPIGEEDDGLSAELHVGPTWVGLGGRF